MESLAFIGDGDVLGLGCVIDAGLSVRSESQNIVVWNYFILMNIMAGTSMLSKPFLDLVVLILLISITTRQERH